jgi:hypothetical protein
VPALTGILGGNLAYVGFTGATGGSFATHTVSSFVFNNYAAQARTLANNFSVNAGATGGLDIVQAGPGVGGAATLTGVLTLNAGSLLNVTGGAAPTDTPYSLSVTGSTTLTGNSTIDVANNGTGLGTVHLDDVSQSGGSTSLTKTGAGTLVLSGALSFAVLNANGGTTQIYGSQTLAALNIGAGGVVVLDGGAPPPAPAVEAEPDGSTPAPAFDAEAAGATAQAVPEPGSLDLILLGALGCLARRQRNPTRTA